MAAAAEQPDPLELLSKVQRRVEEIRRSAHTLLETVTCVQDTSTLKPAVEKIVKDAYADMGKMKSSGRELETALLEFRKGLAGQGIKLPEGAPAPGPVPASGALAGAARSKRCMAAREALEAQLGGIRHVAALEFDAQRPSQPMSKSRRTDAAGGATLLREAVERVKELAGASVRIRLMDPSGAAAEPEHATQIRLDCPDMLTALVALSRKGVPDPVRVVAYSTEEPDPSAWGSSSFLAHRRISALATRALGFYLSRAQALSVPGKSTASGAEATEDLLLWLCSYTDLFTAPCSATGCLLASDLSTQLLLPPLVRPYKVPRSRLRQMALDPAARQPCHLHITSFSQY